MNLDDLVCMFATPVLRYGSVLDEATARARIEALFDAKTPTETLAALTWFSTTGQRQEWASYEYYGPRGYLPAGPKDVARSRKIAFPAQKGALFGTRGLVALDTVRACALAEWSVIAKLLDRVSATTAILPMVAMAVEKHESWADFREQVLLGLEFSEGAIDAELRALVLALDGPWPSAPPKAPEALVTEANPDTEATVQNPRVFAMRLTVDCPSCELAHSPSAFVGRSPCRHCGIDVELTAEDWSYFFSEDVTNLRVSDKDFDPIGNDHGARFFSRRMTREVPTPACSCGAPLAVAAPGIVECECGRRAQVRSADELSRAIDDRTRLVVEPLPKLVDPKATFACAACGESQPLGDDPSRLRECAHCQARTYVDDRSHAQSFDPPRRATLYLVVDA